MGRQSVSITFAGDIPNVVRDFGDIVKVHRSLEGEQAQDRVLPHKGISVSQISDEDRQTVGACPDEKSGGNFAVAHVGILKPLFQYRYSLRERTRAGQGQALVSGSVASVGRDEMDRYN